MNRTPSKMVPEAPDGSSDLNLQQLIEIFRRRWQLLLAVVVLVFAATIAVTLLMTPKYVATAQIKLDPQQKQAIELNANDAMTSPQADQARIDSEVQVLQSRNIARAVAQQLGLARDPEFNKKDVPVQGNAVPEVVIDAILDPLTVKSDAGTYIVNVSFESIDADKASAIANAFIDNYLQDSINRRTSMAARQTASLDKRLDTLGSKVQGQEAQIAQYRAASGIVQGSPQSGTITDQQIASLSTQLASAESEAAAARANLAAARGQVASGGLDAVSSVLSSATVSDLRRQRAEVAREQGEITARYGPKHPESVRVTQQLAGVDQALREESRRIVSGLDSQARAASASAGSLRGELSRLRGEQASNTRASVVADSLERQAKATQNIYDQVAQTAQQTNQSQQNLEPLATVVERAVPPVLPSSPNRPLFAAMGLMLGLIIGVSLVLMLEFLANTVRSAEEIERRLGLPFIVSIPRLSSRQLQGANGTTLSAADFVAQKPMSSYAEALRTIRSTLVLNDVKLRTIAITSSLPGEGKTTTSLSLGRIMALSGNKTILLDCDLRRGGISAIRDTTAMQGLIEVLTGEVALETAIFKDSASDLDMLTLPTPTFTPIDLFSGPNMKALIAELSKRYEYVLLDTPPVLAVADARILASLADTTLFIVRAEHTPRRAARAALDMLQQDGSDVLGAALSMVSPNSRSVTSNDPAYYYRKYRSYHTE